MASKIIPLIPPHTVYVEPFAGGLAVFFAKPEPPVTNSDHYCEVVNDTDRRIVNFYRMLRDRPNDLVYACSMTPYSRVEHTETARQETDDLVESARRWYVDIQQSFSNKSRSGWRTSAFGRNNADSWGRAIDRLGDCAKRMRRVYIECQDALRVIERWDSPQTFFYCDPPYPGSDQGHYAGYTQQDFDALVQTLDNCQGSFILSNYDQPNVPESWERHDFSAYCSASCKGRAGNGRDKARTATKSELGNTKRTEVLWRRVTPVSEWRPELQKVAAMGVYDCFQGGVE